MSPTVSTRRNPGLVAMSRVTRAIQSMVGAELSSPPADRVSEMQLMPAFRQRGSSRSNASPLKSGSHGNSMSTTILLSIAARTSGPTDGISSILGFNDILHLLYETPFSRASNDYGVGR